MWCWPAKEVKALAKRLWYQRLQGYPEAKFKFIIINLEDTENFCLICLCKCTYRYVPEYLCKPLGFLTKVWETHGQRKKGTITKHPNTAKNHADQEPDVWVSSHGSAASKCVIFCKSLSSISAAWSLYLKTKDVRLPGDRSKHKLQNREAHCIVYWVEMIYIFGFSSFCLEHMDN